MILLLGWVDPPWGEVSNRRKDACFGPITTFLFRLADVQEAFVINKLAEPYFL